jgi:hypothetical protein
MIDTSMGENSGEKKKERSELHFEFGLRISFSGAKNPQTQKSPSANQNRMNGQNDITYGHK